MRRRLMQSLRRRSEPDAPPNADAAAAAAARADAIAEVHEKLEIWKVEDGQTATELEQRAEVAVVLERGLTHAFRFSSDEEEMAWLHTEARKLGRRVGRHFANTVEEFQVSLLNVCQRATMPRHVGADVQIDIAAGHAEQSVARTI